MKIEAPFFLTLYDPSKIEEDKASSLRLIAHAGNTFKSVQIYCTPVSVQSYCRIWRQPGRTRGLASERILTNKKGAIKPA